MVPNGLMDDAINFDALAVLVVITLASARAIFPIVVVRAEPLHAHTFARAGVEFIVFIVTVIHLIPARTIIFGVEMSSPNELSAWTSLTTRFENSWNNGDKMLSFYLA
jgi:hypothetical protein